jgi:hypothetical protein
LRTASKIIVFTFVKAAFERCRHSAAVQNIPSAEALRDVKSNLQSHVFLMNGNTVGFISVPKNIIVLELIRMVVEDVFFHHTGQPWADN